MIDLSLKSNTKQVLELFLVSEIVFRFPPLQQSERLEGSPKIIKFSLQKPSSQEVETLKIEKEKIRIAWMKTLR